MSNFSNPLFIAVVVLGVLNIILLISVIFMNLKLKKFLIGINSKNIEDSLSYIRGGLDNLEKFRDKTEMHLESVEDRLQKSVRAVHTVRFNPFQGVGAGGNQSFATAMLNENGDGVIISSLYSRDHVSVFSKPVKTFISEHELSDEETLALNEAKKKL